VNKQRPQSELKFAFSGDARRVMEEHFLFDAANATLSKKFRLYYLLRKFIPVWLRQKLQKSRGSAMTDIPEDWYIPKNFINEFGEALRNDYEQNPDASIIHPWPKPFQSCVSLTHDVETRDGLLVVDRLAKLEESFGFRSCWYFVPHKYKVEPKLIADLKARGHEVGVHGYNHDGRLFSSRKIFEKRRAPIKQAIRDFDAVGFRAPMVHRNLDWILTLKTDYDASCFDVDPYQAMSGGVGSFWPFIKQGMVELPYTLPQDHTLFIALEQDDISVWKHKLAVLRRWCGMGMLVSHPDYMNTEFRFDLYRQFLEHLKSQSDIWFALPKEVSDWWRDRDNSEIKADRTISEPIGDRGQILNLKQLLDDESHADGLAIGAKGIAP
jgi:peptidoglycan/xylan/chitin deacetylase (PgdA/CDA1 family)